MAGGSGAGRREEGGAPDAVGSAFKFQSSPVVGLQRVTHQGPFRGRAARRAGRRGETRSGSVASCVHSGARTRGVRRVSKIIASGVRGGGRGGSQGRDARMVVHVSRFRLSAANAGLGKGGMSSQRGGRAQPPKKQAALRLRYVGGRSPHRIQSGACEVKSLGGRAGGRAGAVTRKPTSKRGHKCGSPKPLNSDSLLWS